MCLISSFLPAIVMTIVAKALMDTMKSLPMFTGPWKSDRIRRRVPSMHSSMYRKLLVCSPSPQISM